MNNASCASKIRDEATKPREDKQTIQLKTGKKINFILKKRTNPTLGYKDNRVASRPSGRNLIKSIIQNWWNIINSDTPLAERKFEQDKWSLPMMIQQAELLRETEHASSLNGLPPGAADWLNAFPSRTLELQITANEDQICSCQTFDGQSYQA